MAELTTVARPYAKAAFQFAEQNNALADWSQMLGFAAQIVEDDSFSQYVNDPTISTAEQAQAFIKVGFDKLDEKGKNFIQLLAQNKRLAVLPHIASLFEQFKAEKEQSIDVEVISAFAISSDQEQNLAAALKRKLDREVKLTSKQDESLIGGVVIHAGDIVIDSSVKGKLAKLAETLNH